MDILKSEIMADYFVCNNKVFEVIGVVGTMLKREDFLTMSKEFIEDIKDSPNFKDKKVFVLGMVKGKELNRILITKPVGDVIISIKVSARKEYTWKGIFKKLLNVITSR